jgi:predicted phosphodiesterase
VRYLILSDIHSNAEALQAVLWDAAERYDQVLCLGDMVGYGADPNGVTEWIREHSTCVIRGNHDKAATGMADLTWFNPIARQAAEWTASQLTGENLAYLRNLAAGPVEVNGFDLVHGAPQNEDDYIVTAYEAASASTAVRRPLTFFGHTHLQGGFLLYGRKAALIPRVRLSEARRVFPLSPEGAFLINPGAVGQPRDNDPRAAYAVYDSEQRTVTYSRVAYDIGVAQEKILAAGLPQLLATRLALGK